MPASTKPPIQIFLSIPAILPASMEEDALAMGFTVPQNGRAGNRRK
jgi:hypothetical protein